MIMEKVLTINPNYTVFSDGRIFSKISGKFLKPWKTNKGYPIVSLFDGKFRIRKTNRAWTIWIVTVKIAPLKTCVG